MKFFLHFVDTNDTFVEHGTGVKTKDAHLFADKIGLDSGEVPFGWSSRLGLLSVFQLSFLHKTIILAHFGPWPRESS